MLSNLKSKVKKKKKQPRQQPHPDYTEDVNIPYVQTENHPGGIVKVFLYVDGLMPTDNDIFPKDGFISMDFLNDGKGFDFEARIDKHAEKVTEVYKFKVNKLPGRIIQSESKWTVKPGVVVLTLVKHLDSANVDFQAEAFKNCLDQESSSSSSDDCDIYVDD